MSASSLSELERLKEDLQRREEEERKVSVVEELKGEIQRLQERRGRQQEEEQRSREFEAVKREVERLQRLKEERETNTQVSPQVDHRGLLLQVRLMTSITDDEARNRTFMFYC